MLAAAAHLHIDACPRKNLGDISLKTTLLALVEGLLKVL